MFVSLMFISTSSFLGYLMANPLFLKNSCGTILPKVATIKGFMPFLRVLIESESNRAIEV